MRNSRWQQNLRSFPSVLVVVQTVRNGAGLPYVEQILHSHVPFAGNTSKLSEDRRKEQGIVLPNAVEYDEQNVGQPVVVVAAQEIPADARQHAQHAAQLRDAAVVGQLAADALPLRADMRKGLYGEQAASVGEADGHALLVLLAVEALPHGHLLLDLLLLQPEHAEGVGYCGVGVALTERVFE